MGLGIGGDYPLSAVISSEFASTKIRGRMMTATFAAQGFGNFGMQILHIAKFTKKLIENPLQLPASSLSSSSPPTRAPSFPNPPLHPLPSTTAGVSSSVLDVCPVA